jgi:hypothetical protein
VLGDDDGFLPGLVAEGAESLLEFAGSDASGLHIKFSNLSIIDKIWIFSRGSSKWTEERTFGRLTWAVGGGKSMISLHYAQKPERTKRRAFGSDEAKWGPEDDPLHVSCRRKFANLRSAPARSKKIGQKHRVQQSPQTSCYDFHSGQNVKP